MSHGFHNLCGRVGREVGSWLDSRFSQSQLRQHQKDAIQLDYHRQSWFNLQHLPQLFNLFITQFLCIKNHVKTKASLMKWKLKLYKWSAINKVSLLLFKINKNYTNIHFCSINKSDIGAVKLLRFYGLGCCWFNQIFWIQNFERLIGGSGPRIFA